MFSVPFLTSITNHLGTTPIDDSSDTLSCLITSFLYLAAAILTSAKTYVGSAMECWFPQTYSGDWGEFAENYCYLKDTYWYPSSEPMNQIPEDHKAIHRLSYYQWSSMYMTVVALAFMIPKFLWKMSQSATDMPLIYFCDTTNEIRTQSQEQRKTKIREMATFMRAKITATHAPHSMASIRMYNVYACIKVLYLFNAGLQFFVLSHFLGQGGNYLWGWNLLINILSGITWETTGLFPRLTFCDFQVREMAGNNRNETIQCVIGINEFNEKIFMFLWFWLVFLFFATLVAHVYSFVQFKKAFFVANLLHTIKVVEKNREQRMMIQEFGDRYLTYDGKLILSFVKSQSDLIAQELAVQMYRDFEEEKFNDPKRLIIP